MMEVVGWWLVGFVGMSIIALAVVAWRAGRYV